MPRGPEGDREIEVLAEARRIEKWRKQVLTTQTKPGPQGATFALISDEGRHFPDGEDTAPSPLSYFVSGVAL